MGNVEFFEMCEISPRVQCIHCLTYWTTGILYWTCGTCLYLTEETRKRIRDRFDTPSIPHNVIKKGPLHGARHGNTERQRIYHSAHTAAKKANKRGYDTLLKRFQNCPICTESQLAIGWGATTKFQKKIIHTCAPQKSIKDVKIVGYWYSTAKVQTVRWNNVKTTPMPSESKSDKEVPKIHPSKQVRQRANQPF